MKKVVITVVLLLIVLVGGGIYLVMNHLDDLLKLAIESYGSETLKTNVTVNKVHVDLKGGDARINGLTVGSPEHFTLPSAFSVDTIYVDVNLEKSGSGLIVIDNILIRAPEAAYEVNKQLQSSWNVLAENVKSTTPSGQKAAASKPEGSEPRIIIRKFTLEQGGLQALITPADRKYNLKLPAITLQNLGGKNGASAEQIVGQIFDAIYSKVKGEIKKQGITDKYQKQVDAEKQKLKSKLDKKAESKKADLKDKLKRVF